MSKSDREPIDEKKSEQTIEIAEYLSTHPANETRSNYLEQLMPKVYEYYDHYWNKLINWNIMKGSIVKKTMQLQRIRLNFNWKNE